jgi:transposase
LAEVDAAGGKVRLVARRHRISESLLYNWRSARNATASAIGAPDAVGFMPIGVMGGVGNQGPVMLAPPEPERVQQSPASEAGSGTIEIASPNGTRVCVDASVSEKALSRVLRAMKGAL